MGQNLYMGCTAGLVYSNYYVGFKPYIMSGVHLMGLSPFLNNVSLLVQVYGSFHSYYSIY
jgi:hypothetical protein